MVRPRYAIPGLAGQRVFRGLSGVIRLCLTQPRTAPLPTPHCTVLTVRKTILALPRRGWCFHIGMLCIDCTKYLVEYITTRYSIQEFVRWTPLHLTQPKWCALADRQDLLLFFFIGPQLPLKVQYSSVLYIRLPCFDASVVFTVRVAKDILVWVRPNAKDQIHTGYGTIVLYLVQYEVHFWQVQFFRSMYSIHEITV